MSDGFLMKRLSHLRTIKSLIASLESEGAAIGLVKCMKNYYFIACCKFFKTSRSLIGYLFFFSVEMLTFQQFNPV